MREAELRQDHYIDAPSLGKLAPGQQVQVLGIDSGWAHVQFEGKTGWMRASNLTSSGATVAAVSKLYGGRLEHGNMAAVTAIRNAENAADAKQKTPVSILEKIHSRRLKRVALMVSADASEHVYASVDSPNYVIVSPKDGYLYMLLAESDAHSLGLATPSPFSSPMKISAHQPLTIDNSTWQSIANAEAVLIIVSDGPWDISQLDDDPTSAIPQIAWDSTTKNPIDDFIKLKSCRSPSHRFGIFTKYKKCSQPYLSELIRKK